MNRVVVTGIGMVSSHGVGKDEIWPKIKEGISAIDFLKRVDNSDLKTKFGGEIADNFNAEDFICLLYTSPSPRDLAVSRMPSSA